MGNWESAEESWDSALRLLTIGNAFWLIVGGYVTLYNGDIFDQLIRELQLMTEATQALMAKNEAYLTQLVVRDYFFVNDEPINVDSGLMYCFPYWEV